jgi:uncharacterized protein
MNNFIILILALFYSITLNADNYYKPSFNCNNIENGTIIEYVICTNKKLSNLDNIVSDLYKQTIDKNLSLKNDQKNWLKKRNQCKTVSCLINSYLKRENSLNNTLLNAKFNSHLQKLMKREKKNIGELYCKDSKKDKYENYTNCESFLQLQKKNVMVIQLFQCIKSNRIQIFVKN